MASSTVENYIKEIYNLVRKSGKNQVSMGALVAGMQVAPGTATAMVKTLQKSGLVDYAPRSGVKFTPGGRTLALHVIRRHRLVESFLVQVLQLDWSEVHDEAEALEHVVSDKVLEAMEKLLGYPDRDPHGDPIPSADGELPDHPLTHLSDCDEGSVVRIRRVSDKDSDFLVFLDQAGLRPGAVVTVASRSPYAGSLSVQPNDGEALPLGIDAARRVLVEPV